MKYSVTFASKAWEEYVRWGDEDPAIQLKINALIADIATGNPYQGIGKPERLSGNYSGWGSRRITQAHRLVYRVQLGAVEIAQCYGHYLDH